MTRPETSAVLLLSAVNSFGSTVRYIFPTSVGIRFIIVCAIASPDVAVINAEPGMIPALNLADAKPVVSATAVVSVSESIVPRLVENLTLVPSLTQLP